MVLVLLFFLLSMFNMVMFILERSFLFGRRVMGLFKL